jgi:ectoine hydroxylase-related dioxygenase (phytanoyl-CoA dioxygenase family)
MATAASYGAQEGAMQAYFGEGEARAMALGNRGPIRFTAEGALDPAILAAYRRYGFYVFEDVLSAAELAELEADYLAIIDRLPVVPGGALDRRGRPALGADRAHPMVHWARPLGDPFGNTAVAKGRHSVKMFEPEPAAGLPEQVPFIVTSPLEYSDAYLRLTGHPGLLRVAAAINGEDFVPFQEGMIMKRPGEGASFSWHQDGTTHWDSPDWDLDCHGVNVMPQLYGSTAANGVWFVPGSHAAGKVDIAAMVDAAGSERLPDAVPLVCRPGDVAISNRQVVHGSFANTSDDCRVTLSFGFHPRRWVLGATGYLYADNAPVTYDAERIRRRSEMIGYAIDARRQRFPGETPYVYRPHEVDGRVYRWDAAARDAISGYSDYDLRI